MKIIDAIVTKSDCYKTGEIIAVKGLMLHSVGCNQPSAQVFVDKWNKPDKTVCAHALIDGNTGDIYKVLPWNYRGWHCGRSGNNTHIGVEMCEASTIKYTGGSSWVDLDAANTKATVLRTYKAAVELFAYLCKKFNLDPLKDGVIVSHAEGYKKGIASNHGDVEHIWNKYGLTMDGFRKEVAAAMKPQSATKELYRVQVGAYKNINNATKQLEKVKNAGFEAILKKVDSLYKVQVGAYSQKENAEKMLDKIKKAGFDGYITYV